VFGRTVGGKQLPVHRSAATVINDLSNRGFRPAWTLFGKETATFMLLPDEIYNKLVDFLGENRDRIINPQGVRRFTVNFKAPVAISEIGLLEPGRAPSAADEGVLNRIQGLALDAGADKEKIVELLQNCFREQQTINLGLAIIQSLSGAAMLAAAVLGYITPYRT
jgi:hypothetical protein